MDARTQGRMAKKAFSNSQHVRHTRTTCRVDDIVFRMRVRNNGIT